MRIILFLLLAVSLFAQPYWVSNNGAAAWESAQSASPLSGTSCASLSTANSNASAGDTVYMRAGTYNVDVTGIVPSASGTLANRILFKAYAGDSVVFNRSSSNNSAIAITGKDYIVVDSIFAIDLSVWIRIGNGADYNEIRYCTFIGDNDYDHAIRIFDGGGGTASTHNWLHNNTFAKCGYVSAGCNDEK